MRKQITQYNTSPIHTLIQHFTSGITDLSARRAIAQKLHNHNYGKTICNAFQIFSSSRQTTRCWTSRSKLPKCVCWHRGPAQSKTGTASTIFQGNVKSFQNKHFRLNLQKALAKWVNLKSNNLIECNHAYVRLWNFSIQKRKIFDGH